MALQTIECTNKPLEFGIQVDLEWTNDDIGDVDSVHIYKRSGTSGIYEKVIEHAVSSGNDLTFSFLDVGVACGTTYYYVAYAMTGTIQTESCIGNAKCLFDGMAISDITGLWHSAFGASDSEYKYDIKKNTKVQYVSTISGAYPKRIINDSSNYYSGNFTALFVPTDANGGINIGTDVNAHRKGFLEFLCNGNEKLLRTSGGEIFRVSIDSSPQENWNQIDALRTVTFNWTQVGDVVNSDQSYYVPVE